jgi:hypothetical protein
MYMHWKGSSKNRSVGTTFKMVDETIADLSKMLNRFTVLENVWQCHRIFKNYLFRNVFTSCRKFLSSDILERHIIYLLFTKAFCRSRLSTTILFLHFATRKRNVSSRPGGSFNPMSIRVLPSSGE